MSTPYVLFDLYQEWLFHLSPTSAHKIYSSLGMLTSKYDCYDCKLSF